MPDRHPRGLRRDARPGQGRRVRLPRHQRLVVADDQRGARRASPRPGRDGIIQVSTGGAEYFAGQTVKDMVTGALAFAAFAHEVAKNYPVNVALHTDHCPKDKLDGFVRPLIAASEERGQGRRRSPIFQSHMWDGSAVPLDENLEIAAGAARRCAKAAHIILEVEIGVVGGEEDGVATRSTSSSTRRSTTRSRPSRRSASARTAATWPRSPSATCTASTSRATSSCAPRCSSEIQERSSPRKYGRRQQAARPRLPRRLRLAARGDRGGRRLRRRQDERRHRHAVRLHPPGRRLHVQELRRRAQDRRRGRQQEGVRPARLGQGGRGRHGRPRRRGLRRTCARRAPSSELGSAVGGNSTPAASSAQSPLPRGGSCGASDEPPRIACGPRR